MPTRLYTTMFESSDAAEVSLLKMRCLRWQTQHMRPHKLKSIVARNPRTGRIMVTSPILTNAGITYLADAARHSGWQPLYVITVRPKR